MSTQQAAEHAMQTKGQYQTQTIDLRAAGRLRQDANVLLETDRLSLIQIHLDEGQERPAHKATGEVFIECRNGQTLVWTPGGEYSLSAGQAICLAPEVEHSLRGIRESEVLLLNCSEAGPKAEKVVPGKDNVQEASEESFPASDPPSWSRSTSS